MSWLSELGTKDRSVDTGKWYFLDKTRAFDLVNPDSDCWDMSVLLHFTIVKISSVEFYGSIDSFLHWIIELCWLIITLKKLYSWKYLNVVYLQISQLFVCLKKF